MVIERMICLSNESTAQPVVARQNDYNAAEIRLLVYESPKDLLDMTGMAAVVIYDVDGVPTNPYEAKVEDKHWLHFTLPAEVTERHGNGRMQIGIYLANSLTHSYMLPYEVEHSLPMPGPGTEGDPAPAFFSLVREAREAMANVKDGGYYIPDVSENGDLSWRATEPDMPEVPKANIAGKDGKDGGWPSIGENGNWMINGTDTGVKADWSNEQENAAASAAAASKSAKEAADIAAALGGEIGGAVADPIAVTANGAMVSIDDAAARPAVQLISTIAYSAGSGCDTIKVMGVGKNFFPDGNVQVTGSKSVYFTLPLPPGTYMVGAEITSEATGTVSRITFVGGREDGSNLAVDITRGVQSSEKVIVSNPVERIVLYSGTNNSNSSGKTAEWRNVQIVTGAELGEYEPYHSKLMEAILPETVYGGRINWTAGEVVSTLDADGDLLPVEKVIEIDPQKLTLLKGTNNVWSDCGDTELTYIADTKAYIDKKFAALAAAVIGV